jgi:hypothetical protein
VSAPKGLGAFEPGDLEINGKKLAGNLLEIVTDAEPKRTISGASTIALSIDDPDGWLLKSGLYVPQEGHRTDLHIDGLWFRSCALSKSSDKYTWTFESRPVALLRQYNKPKRVSRSKSTLAQFLKSCVAEVPSIGFVSPELTKKQPIADRTGAEKQEVRDRNASKGIGYGSNVTIKGVKAVKEQIDLLNVSLEVAESHGATNDRAAIALIIAEIDESEVHNYEHFTESSGDSLGVLQYEVSRWGRARAIDPRFCVADFLTKGSTKAGGAIALALKNPSWTPAQIASANQGNREGASVYAPYEAEAKKILEAYGGMTPGPSADDADTYVKQFLYSRGEPQGPRKEDTWACGVRYAELVKWRWFELNNRIYWISDFDLVRSRPRLTLNENSPGIDSIDFNLDVSEKKPDTATVNCRMADFGAPPGTVVALTQDTGPAVAGAWIVAEASKPSIGLLNGTVVLTRPNAPKAEPSSSIVVRPGGEVGEDQGGLDPKSHVMKALEKAKWINAHKFPYEWGGGHRSDGTFGPCDSAGGYTGRVGYDCSGMVDDILHSAELFDGFSSMTLVEGLFKWGVPGKGKYMTVWLKGPNDHCFIEFDLPTGTVFYEAHHTGTIVGEERDRQTGEMTPRHWPGT